MALDSAGDGLFSLSYSNTNSDTFGLFIKHLVDHLNSTRKKWRQNTILLIDNAPYH